MRLLITCVLLIGANLLFAQKKLSQHDVRKLHRMMSGAYNSQSQSERDTSYFNVHLHMLPVWPERTDGKWLYVEQAMSTALDKPYRQRFYRVHLQGDTVIVSDVFTIADPLRFAGAWKKTTLLNGITADSLEAREGCSLLLKKANDGSFSGSTVNNNCPSNLRGASYATSKVKITKKLLASWDQGFDTSGKQVWGATKGGYEFIKYGKLRGKKKKSIGIRG